MKKILKLNENLFWDIDNKSLDIRKHKRFIIFRILERGNWPDFKELIKYYSYETVKKETLLIRHLDKKTLIPWFGIPCFSWQDFF